MTNKIAIVLVLTLLGCSDVSDSKQGANMPKKVDEINLPEHKQNSTTKKPNEKDLKSKIQELVFAKFKDSRLLEIIRGDLNTDEYQDIIAIVTRTCLNHEGTDTSITICRKVLFFINNGLNQYKLEAYNDNILDCSTCGGGGVGDPHQSIRIKNGSITFESFYGACDKTTIFKIFKYDSRKKNWYLREIRTESYSCKQEPVEGEIKINRSIETIDDFGIITFSENRY